MRSESWGDSALGGRAGERGSLSSHLDAVRTLEDGESVKSAFPGQQQPGGSDWVVSFLGTEVSHIYSLSSPVRGQAQQVPGSTE